MAKCQYNNHMGRPLLSKYSGAVTMYEQGMSIEQVGQKFGLSRQAMWDALRRRGAKFRHKEPQPFIEFEGLKYSLSKDGYYRATTFRRINKMLHQDVWRKFVGEIPDGWDIHHKHENDKATVDPNRLECLTPSNHTRIYGHQANPIFPQKFCAHCCVEFFPHRDKQIKESPSAFIKRRFCSFSCGRFGIRRKPKC